MDLMMRKFVSIFCVLLLCVLPSALFADVVGISTADTVSVVICNVVEYIWKFGGPLMTVVIIGAAMLAIFGKMQWSALIALAVFTAVFFGASSILTMFIGTVTGVNVGNCTMSRITD